MLNEPSTIASGNYHSPTPAVSTVEKPKNPDMEQLEMTVASVMDIYKVDTDPAHSISLAFTGRLRIDSETAYERLEANFAPLDYHPLLSTNEQGQHIILALKGRIHPPPRPWWPNALLFVLTVFSLLYVGALHQAGLQNETEAPPLSEIWRGWPYALSLILILGTHELGHYFAARYHKVNVTLPYFIPMPFSGFGTLGAFIQLRAPMRNRKVLFDVGAAGPLAGLIVAIPILIIGLATSKVESLPDEPYVLEGDSLIYTGAKALIFGEFLPNGEEDVFINQLAKAGWTGLFVTALNLIPLGQLDGGHVTFTLFGQQARRLYIPLITGFMILSLFNPNWLLWTLILLLLGRFYAVPLDSVTPLDKRRRWVGYAALIMFVLVFVPNPLQLITP